MIVVVVVDSFCFKAAFLSDTTTSPFCIGDSNFSPSLLVVISGIQSLIFTERFFKRLHRLLFAPILCFISHHHKAGSTGSYETLLCFYTLPALLIVLFFSAGSIFYGKRHTFKRRKKVHPLKEASKIKNAIYTIYTLFLKYVKRS